MKLSVSADGTVQVHSADITDDQLAVQLYDLAGVRRLILIAAQITGRCLSAIRHPEAVEELNLWQTSVAQANLITALKAMPNLRVLKLESLRIGNEIMPCMRKLARLEVLDIQDTYVNDSGMSYLAGLNRLHTLNVSDTRVTSKGFQHLKGLPSLSILDASGTWFDDISVSYLSDSLRLRSLKLNNTRITDRALPHLTALIQRQKEQALPLFDELDATRTWVTGFGAKPLEERGVYVTPFSDYDRQEVNLLRELRNLFEFAAKEAKILPGAAVAGLQSRFRAGLRILMRSRQKQDAVG